jgi:L-malate glycosyltransferase
VKIAFLAPGTSIHTQRWVAALAQRGHQMTLFTQHLVDSASEASQVAIEKLPFCGSAGYFLNAPRLRARLAALQPDILNVHYASGYGTTAGLAGFKPTLLSVWGSDVYDFPREASWKSILLRRNLRSATRIASTSHVMGRQVRTLVPDLPAPFITPFGVDCERFRPQPDRDPRYITIGTVKALSAKYGIDVLLRAFALLRSPAVQCRLPADTALRLVLVGDGDERTQLERLAAELAIADAVTFVGWVNHAEVPGWLNRFDVFVAASRLESESFGVAAVEAGACGVPVVVSDAGGLPEVVRDGQTGLVVPRENPAALALALEGLIVDASLRRRLGEEARRFVLANYEWAHCVDTMESVYRDTVLAACAEVGFGRGA